MGVYEGTEEVLAVADHPRIVDAGDADCPDARVGRCPLRVHAVLNERSSERRIKEGEGLRLERQVGVPTTEPSLARHKRHSRIADDTPKSR